MVERHSHKPSESSRQKEEFKKSCTHMTAILKNLQHHHKEEHVQGIEKDIKDLEEALLEIKKIEHLLGDKEIEIINEIEADIIHNKNYDNVIEHIHLLSCFLNEN